MKKLFSLGLLVLFAMALVVAAGCGGEDSSDAKKVVVGTNPTFAPFESVDENGEYVGFDIDLIRAIGEVNNWNVVIKDYPFKGLVPALESSSIDACIAAMTIDEERENKVDFTVPYYQSGLCIAVLESNDSVKGIEDLEGKRIGVQLGTTGAKAAREIPGADVVDYKDVNSAYMSLGNESIDAVLNDYPVTANYISKSKDDDVKIVGEILNSEFYGIAVPKDKPEIQEEVNSALETLKENGEYAEIYKEWFAEAPAEFLPGEPAEK
ncbi:MAG: basic amino acid ABC transporter substrate-binding protein [Clostridiales bacterium]|nr:basic amino acid ABC transporter substrate-binding protein [Clostridiales bacterium]MCF8022145.1 basic amino acid ABC transporter substrate-binding protein [Clostridiales bacterium]